MLRIQRLHATNSTFATSDYVVQHVCMHQYLHTRVQRRNTGSQHDTSSVQLIRVAARFIRVAARFVSL